MKRIPGPIPAPAPRSSPTDVLDLDVEQAKNAQSDAQPARKWLKAQVLA
ncbi:hypothetical protein [Pseudonocardia sp. 73-21]|mgnify:FL=1|jgi:hypothetical protein|nr:hypothetical protein [Pseudonocardia sp. 73-21]